MCAPWHMHTHAQVHARHKYAGKRNIKAKQKLWRCRRSAISEQSGNLVEANRKYKTENTCSEICKYVCFVGTQFLYSSLLLLQSSSKWYLILPGTAYSKQYKDSQAWWYRSVIPGFRQVDFCEFTSGLHSEFQASKGYIVQPSLKKRKGVLLLYMPSKENMTVDVIFLYTFNIFPRNICTCIYTHIYIKYGHTIKNIG